VPELPEVETTRRGITPHIKGEIVQQVVIRNPKMRLPVSGQLKNILPGQRINELGRRGKYLLLQLDRGTLILHLGMSGSLRIAPPGTNPEKHDHFDLQFSDMILRLRDPRRFGVVVWSSKPPEQHRLLQHLGPEPFSSEFNGDYLHRLAQRRHGPVKSFIMDGKVVVGVGNIYANEALFGAGIHPNRPCNRISKQRYQILVKEIQAVLHTAIQQGGTTLRDFRQEDGQPGYFAQQLQVYGKEGEPCPSCGATIKQQRIGQRASCYCPQCQR
jgi:formamidopyrimidine-DNA glycosylase